MQILEVKPWDKKEKDHIMTDQGDRRGMNVEKDNWRGRMVGFQNTTNKQILEVKP